MRAPDPGLDADRTAPANLPAAVVLNLHETGLGIARSLARRGVHVVGVGADDRAPGTASRHVTFHRAPDSGREPEACVAFLEKLGPRFDQRPVLFPTNDADLICLDAYRARLAPYYVLALPPSNLLRTLSDKVHQMALARAHGVAAPVTHRVSSPADLDAAADTIVYPAVIKPAATTAWRTDAFRERVRVRKGWRVANHDECRAAYARIAEVAPDALVQEWIDGPEDGYRIVGAAMDANGTALGAFAARKRLQYPPGIGLGCVVEAEPDDALVERTLAFLRAIGFVGICEVEYKDDARSGACKLIEINPRFWDQHGLGRAIGVDLPWLAYRDGIGLPAPPRRAPAVRAVWLRWPGVAGSLKEAVKTGNPAVLRVLWRAPWRRRCYAFWASDDPRPLFQALRDRWFRTARD